MNLKQKIVVSLSLAVILTPLSGSAANPRKVESELLNDIKKSRQQLQSIERGQLRQRQSLAKKLHTAEQDVGLLREKYATLQRLADEKTLALDVLQQRLKSWQDQDAYQAYALTDYLAKPEQEVNQRELKPLLIMLQQTIAAQQAALQANWQPRQIVDQHGQLKTAQVLQLGPVSWAISSDDSGGLLDRQGQIPSIALASDAEQSQLWQQQQTQGSGILHFDPSLNRAIKLAQQQESVLEHINKGGLWAMPILAFGLIALLCALAKSWQLSRLPKWLPALALRIKNKLKNGDLVGAQALQQQLQQQRPGSQSKLLAICLGEPNIKQREDALFNYLMFDKQHLEHWLGTIAIIAAVAPLLGLLGTVSGMIETFKLMTIFGSGDASVVSGGISEALVTTELGLIVAIPALLLHAVLQRWVKQQLSLSEAFAIELSQLEINSTFTQEAHAA